MGHLVLIKFLSRRILEGSGTVSVIVGCNTPIAVVIFYLLFFLLSFQVEVQHRRSLPKALLEDVYRCQEEIMNCHPSVQVLPLLCTYIAEPLPLPRLNKSKRNCEGWKSQSELSDQRKRTRLSNFSELPKSPSSLASSNCSTLSACSNDKNVTSSIMSEIDKAFAVALSNVTNSTSPPSGGAQPSVTGSSLNAVLPQTIPLPESSNPATPTIEQDSKIEALISDFLSTQSVVMPETSLAMSASLSHVFPAWSAEPGPVLPVAAAPSKVRLCRSRSKPVASNSMSEPLTVAPATFILPKPSYSIAVIQNHHAISTNYASLMTAPNSVAITPASVPTTVVTTPTSTLPSPAPMVTTPTPVTQVLTTGRVSSVASVSSRSYRVPSMNFSAISSRSATPFLATPLPSSEWSPALSSPTPQLCIEDGICSLPSPVDDGRILNPDTPLTCFRESLSSVSSPPSTPLHQLFIDEPDSPLSSPATPISGLDEKLASSPITPLSDQYEKLAAAHSATPLTDQFQNFFSAASGRAILHGNPKFDASKTTPLFEEYSLESTCAASNSTVPHCSVLARPAPPSVATPPNGSSQLPVTANKSRPAPPPVTARVSKPAPPPVTARVSRPAPPPVTARVSRPAPPPVTASVSRPAPPPVTASASKFASFQVTTSTSRSTPPSVTASTVRPAPPPVTPNTSRLASCHVIASTSRPAPPSVTASTIRPAPPPVTPNTPRLASCQLTASTSRPAVPLITASSSSPASFQVTANTSEPAPPTVTSSPSRPAPPSVTASPSRPALPTVTSSPSRPAPPSVTASPSIPATPTTTSPVPIVISSDNSPVTFDYLPFFSPEPPAPMVSQRLTELHSIKPGSARNHKDQLTSSVVPTFTHKRKSTTPYTIHYLRNLSAPDDLNGVTHASVRPGPSFSHNSPASVTSNSINTSQSSNPKSGIVSNSQLNASGQSEESSTPVIQRPVKPIPVRPRPLKPGPITLPPTHPSTLVNQRLLGNVPISPISVSSTPTERLPPAKLPDSELVSPLKSVEGTHPWMTNLPVKVEHLSDAFGESTSSASSELCLDSQDMQLLPSPPPLIKVSNCSDVTQSCSAGSMSSSDIIQSHSVNKYLARRPQGDASFSPHHVNLIGK